MFHSLFFWLIITHSSMFVVGAFFGWNNPKNKVLGSLETEIEKAIKADKTELATILMVIKAKL